MRGNHAAKLSAAPVRGLRAKQDYIPGRTGKLLCQHCRRTCRVISVADNTTGALRAKGDSMINARIHDGDLVFVRRQGDVNDGEIAVVVLDDEATLKRVRRKGSLTLLLAENPAYEPLVIGGEGETRAVHILGKAVALQTDIR